MANPELRTVGQVFAARLRRARQARGLTQTGLVQRLESEFGCLFPRSSLNRIERGKTRAENLPVRDLLALCAALNVSPAFLLAPDDDDERVSITPKLDATGAQMRSWLRGNSPLRGEDDWADFYLMAPRAELEALAREAARAREIERVAQEADISVEQMLRLGLGAQSLASRYVERQQQREEPS